MTRRNLLKSMLAAPFVGLAKLAPAASKTIPFECAAGIVVTSPNTVAWVNIPSHFSHKQISQIASNFLDQLSPNTSVIIDSNNDHWNKA